MSTMMNMHRNQFKLLATLLYSLLFVTGCTASAVGTEQPYRCIFIDTWKEPSGAWTALSLQCQSGPPRVEVLSSNSKRWSFELPQYDNHYAYFLYKWSYQEKPDNEFLYFYSLLLWPWDSGWNTYQPARELFRMNLSNGETNNILQEREDRPYNAISLSPDEESIVYLSLHGPDKVIGIRNIQTTKERTAVIVGFDDGGNFLWSPSQQDIAFVLSNIAYDQYDNPFPDTETVFILDTDTMTFEQIYSADTSEESVTPISWKGQNLVIEDERFEYLVSVNVETKEESKFDPTPTP